MATTEMNIDRHINDVNRNITEYYFDNIHVSIINSLRRVILSDIPIYGFKGFPHHESNINIIKNNTRLNNEIIKHRISCIPVHIKDKEIPIEDYIVELNVKNDTDENIYVTTNDFKIKHIKTDKYLSKEETNKIFPPNSITGDYIIIARLRGKLSLEIPSEELKIEAKLTQHTAKEDSVYNVASTCSYSFRVDEERQSIEWKKQQQKLEKQELSDPEIKSEKQNWYLGEGRRIIKDKHFKFILESIGIIENDALLYRACSILLDKFNHIKELISKNELDISRSKTNYVSLDTKPTFDILLKNIDYTIGKPLEYSLYSLFYEKENSLLYISFNKEHPHDEDSILRITLHNTNATQESVLPYIDTACDNLIHIYKQIQTNIQNLST